MVNFDALRKNWLEAEALGKDIFEKELDEVIVNKYKGPGIEIHHNSRLSFKLVSEVLKKYDPYCENIKIYEDGREQNVCITIIPK